MARQPERAIRRSDVVFMYDNPKLYEAYGATVLGWAGWAKAKHIEAARAKKLWPLLNTLNFGSDLVVNRVLESLPAGLGMSQQPLRVAGAYASGGAVGSSLRPVNLTLNINGRAENVSLLCEREEVEHLERIHMQATRGRVRG